MTDQQPIGADLREFLQRSFETGRHAAESIDQIRAELGEIRTDIAVLKHQSQEASQVPAQIAARLEAMQAKVSALEVNYAVMRRETAIYAAIAGFIASVAVTFAMKFVG